MTVFLYAKATEQGGGIAFGIPAFELGEALFKFGCTHSVGLTEVGFCIESVFLLHDIPQMRMAAEHCFEHGAVIELEVVLFENAHTLAGALLD